MSWVLTTGCNEGYAAVRDISWPNHAAYAEKWGMSFMPQDWPMVEPKHMVSWTRLDDIRAGFRCGADWVVCLDTDAVFLDDAWIGAGLGDKSVYLAYQTLGGEFFPSCGLMIVRNDNVGHRWICELAAAAKDYRDNDWCEQAVAYDLLGYDSEYKWPGKGQRRIKVGSWEDRVGFLPPVWHSTPQNPVPDAHLFHATGGVGVGVETRVRQLEAALKDRNQLSPR